MSAASLTAEQIRCSAVNLMAMVLWGLALASAIMPLPQIWPEAAVSVAVLLMLPDISRTLRIPLLICILVTTVLIASNRDLSPLLASLDFAAPLAAFLVAVSMLRNSLTGGARGVLARDRLGELSPVGQRSVVLLLSFVLSTVFLIGSFPLLAPLVKAREQSEARALAAAALCGSALSFLWSPFSVGTAFSTEAVGIIAGPASTGLMFAIALYGLVIALAIHGQLKMAVLRYTAAVVRPVLFPLGLTVAVTLVAAFGCCTRVTVVVPFIAPLLVGLLSIKRPGGVGMARWPADGLRTLPQWGGALKDLLIFVVGFALARALSESRLPAMLADAVTSLQVGTLVPSALVLIVIVLGLLGVPAMMSAGLVAATSPELLAGAPVLARLALTLFAWASASMLAVTSGSLVIAASTFGVPVGPLVLGRNLAVIAALGAMLAATLTFIA